MGKSIYSEANNITIYANDVVSIPDYPNVKWVVKNGWFIVNGKRQNGWYLLSVKDKTTLALDDVGVDNLTKITEHATSTSERPTPVIADEVEDTINFYIALPDGTTLNDGDVVEISGYDNVNWIVKNDWYKLGTAQIHGWFFLSIADKTIIPVDQIDLHLVTKTVQESIPEYRPTIKNEIKAPGDNDYIVIPGTNIRLYDSDVIKISNKPRVKWVVHMGWYIYQNVQNFGWYIESIKDGEILPVSIIDLTLVTLVTTKTQGSELYDGKKVYYTRPFTDYDANVLDRTFITVDTVEQRNNLDPRRLVNGRVVRVNDVGGVPVYYAYNLKDKDWEKIDTGGGAGIPEVIGTLENPIIISQLEKGLYRVKGIYLISPTSDTTVDAKIDELAFVSGSGNKVDIKIITDKDITDYIVTSGFVTFSNKYATELYVGDQISVVEQQISEIISELSGFIKKSVESGATFKPGQWFVFDNSGNAKGLDATAENVEYVPPESGPTSTVTNVQNAIDILNARLKGTVLYDTEENWNAQPQLISAKGSIYVYSNHESYQDHYIPGIKIGDGVSYLIDMAFIDDIYAHHIKDTIIHVSTADREFWGDKVTCDLDIIKRNTLIFSKE